MNFPMILSLRLSSYKHLQKMVEAFMCIGNILSIKQQKIADSKKWIHQQFVLECYGIQPGIFTLRRNLALRRKNLSTSNSDG